LKINIYESAVIINAALDDEPIEAEISRIQETITTNGGEIREVDNWGRKRLAYMVEKSKIGYYVIFRFNAPSALISKLERYYVLNENILRYLTIKLEPEAVDYLEKIKEKSLTDIINPSEAEQPKEAVEEPIVEKEGNV
jgi:small subunit ribosomal protein S6